jgi:hypothetical protein
MHLPEAHEPLIGVKRLLIGINRVDDDYWQLVATLPEDAQPAQLPRPRQRAGSRAAAAAKRGGTMPQEQPLPPVQGVKPGATDDDIPF